MLPVTAMIRPIIVLQTSAYLARRRVDERGATSVEYALMMAMIAVSCIGAFTYFREANNRAFNRSGNAINASIG